MSKQFSIIIITRNRAKIISNVLSTIVAMDFPRENYELIVVDNGSDDDTSGVVNSFMSTTDIDWNIITEPVAGICRARNTGHAQARGEWVVYLDDDALVPSNWLDAYQNAISKHPYASAFGGPAVIDSRLILPWWWSRWLDAIVSCQDYGDNMMPYKGYTHPYGLNMVFNRRILDKYGGFDIALDSIIPGLADETDLFYRMIRDKEVLIYVPTSRVVHSVLQDRLKLLPVLKRSFRIGRSLACLDSRYNTCNYQPLTARYIAIRDIPEEERSPVLFLKEFCEWYGYVKFNATLMSAL